MPVLILFLHAALSVSPFSQELPALLNRLRPKWCCIRLFLLHIRIVCSLPVFFFEKHPVTPLPWNCAYWFFGTVKWLVTNQLNVVFSWYFANWLLGSLAVIRGMIFLFLTTADVLWFSLLFCFCQSCTGLRIVGLGAVLRMSSDAGKKLWASAIKSLFCTGRKGIFSMKQALFFFYPSFFPCFFFSLFSTKHCHNRLFPVWRKQEMFGCTEI